MARNLGTPGGQVPPAVRSTSPGWRDPRLWVGIAIVAASVLVGTRVLASADDTAQVWAVADEASAGQELTQDDLEVRRLRFDDAADLDRYFEVGADLPDDLTLAHGLGAGELVPRSAVGAADDADTVTISLAVSSLLVPSGVRPGSVVHVYVAGEASDPGAGGTREEPREAGVPVLEGVRVVAAGAADEFGAGDRQVELAVPAEEVAGFYTLVGSLTTPVVSLGQVS
ncbi:hypothetical protein [Nocardioides sp.]|uniref:hypothetical protein n=1 Tax=Nocardioides sp. TaxID=35761 RepID=UPI00271B6D95|nr:hypothetical protein [Nocardioides sp.]MDO9455662.1 hypothetical protein [Nocardioides sp.]